MSFDPSHLISTAIGLAIAGGALFVRSTSDTKIAAAMIGITAKVESFGKDVMDKMDGLREALHGVASANSVAAERHANLSAAHEKLDGRVTRIEKDLYTTTHQRVANGAAE